MSTENRSEVLAKTISSTPINTVHLPIPNKHFNLTSTQKVVQELLASGYTATKLAHEVDVAISTISRLARGHIKRTKNGLFTKLIALHCNVFGERV